MQEVLKRIVRNVSLLSCIGMFFVLIAGVAVTKMDAGRGCGTDWPLCNGKFIPAYTVESFLEYNHRLISGIVGIIVAAAFVLVWRYMRENKEAVIYAGSSLFFTVLQAILGAMAVVRPQSDAVLALHFGFSLIAFACTYLLVKAVGKSESASEKPENLRYSSGYYALLWISAIFCYVVVYLGAYVRHTESFAGCTGWPLCNGEWIPELTGAAGIVFIHRLSALILFILIAWVTIWTLRAREMPAHMRRAGNIVFITIILQILSGALVTFALENADVYVFTAMLHTMIIAAMFSVQCYMIIEVWKSRRALRRVGQTAETSLG